MSRKGSQGRVSWERMAGQRRQRAWESVLRVHPPKKSSGFVSNFQNVVVLHDICKGQESVWGSDAGKKLDGEAAWTVERVSQNAIF